MADLHLEHLSRRELVALVERYAGGLALGRRKGSDVQRLAAVLRRGVVEQAVADLVRSPEARRWTADAMITYLFDRQREIGLRQLYARSTFDRIVRRSLAKAGRALRDSG